MHQFLFTFSSFSLFVFSNESINVWSHLVGFFYFFCLLLFDNLVTIPESSGTTSDYVVLSLLLSGYMVKKKYCWKCLCPFLPFERLWNLCNFNISFRFACYFLHVITCSAVILKESFISGSHWIQLVSPLDCVLATFLHYTMHSTAIR